MPRGSTWSALGSGTSKQVHSLIDHQGVLVAGGWFWLAGGTTVPGGLCVSTLAYRRFVAGSGLDLHLRRELRRKPFEDMRWEELWDAALRIRNLFLTARMPDDLAGQLRAKQEYGHERQGGGNENFKGDLAHE